MMLSAANAEKAEATLMTKTHTVIGVRFEA